MRVIIVSDDTRIRTSEGQKYKRTGYLPDHNVTAAVVTNEGQDYKRTVYLLDHNVTAAVVTNEGQDYKRTVYLLDNSVTPAVVSTSTIFLRTYINVLMRIYIF